MITDKDIDNFITSARIRDNQKEMLEIYLKRLKRFNYVEFEKEFKQVKDLIAKKEKELN